MTGSGSFCGRVQMPQRGWKAAGRGSANSSNLMVAVVTGVAAGWRPPLQTQTSGLQVRFTTAVWGHCSRSAVVREGPWCEGCRMRAVSPAPPCPGAPPHVKDAGRPADAMAASLMPQASPAC